MSALRQEIEQEMQSVRIDKTRLFNLLLRMVDSGVGGGSGGVGPQGPPGPAGPKCECNCDTKAAPAAKAPAAKAPAKKAPAKKKPASHEA